MMTIAERRRRCRELVKRHYAHLPSREDRMDEVVGSLSRPGDVLLDAGCGSTLALLERYASGVKLAVGIDVCMPAPAARSKDRVAVGNLERLPLASESVDVIVSRSVVEHLDDPDTVFAELARVLRPGGRLVFTTPNKYYYSCAVAWLTPEALKSRYFSRVFGVDAYDHFPVRYRANTRRAFRRLAHMTGLALAHVEAIPHYPFYLMFSPLLFRLGMLYDAAVEWLRADALKSTWLVVMEKR